MGEAFGQRTEGLRGSEIGEVPVSRGDPLLHRPWALRIVLQQSFIVVGFDNQGAHTADRFCGQMRDIAEVTEQPDSTAPLLNAKSNRILCIVWDRKGKNAEVGHGKVTARFKKAEWGLRISCRTPEDPRRSRIAVNRDGVFPEEDRQPGRVILVFVSDQNAIQIRQPEAHRLQALLGLLRREPRVNQQGRASRFHQGAIPRTPTPQYADLHLRILPDRNPGSITIAFPGKNSHAPPRYFGSHGRVAPSWKSASAPEPWLFPRSTTHGIFGQRRGLIGLASNSDGI